MPEFVNPYNFVRSEYNAQKTEPPHTHERIYPELYSGRLGCSLRTISRITTKSLDWDKGRCIYGSSLKGMVRSVAEAMAQACFPFGKGNLGKCRAVNRLCICCRIFGWLHGGKVHTGRVQISDAEPPEGTNWREETYIECQALSSPKPNHDPNHDPFYRVNGQPRGRKFYYHHNPSRGEQKITSQPKTIKNEKNQKITLAKVGQTFSFRIDFTDLNGPELGLLLYAMQLEEGWYHKLGYAKPLGFGTVKITVDTVTLLPPDRCDNWDTRITSVEDLTPEAARVQNILSTILSNIDVKTAWNTMTPDKRRGCFIDTRIEEFFQYQFGKSRREANTLPHWRDLCHLLTQHDDYDIRYPSGEWFDQHKGTPLPTAAEVEGDPPGNRSKWLKD